MMSAQANKARTHATNAVFAGSRPLFWVSALATAVTGLVSPQSAVAVLAALLIAFIWLMSVMTSLRFYRPWLPCAAWFVPFTLVTLVSEPIRIGAISLMSVAFAYALAAAIVFGALGYANSKLREWIDRGGF